MTVRSVVASGQGLVSPEETASLIAEACPVADFRAQKVLVIVPDATRTAPVDLVFRALHDQLAGSVARLDVMVALGTHQPMSEADICRRLGMTAEERRSVFRDVRFYNHEWDNPAALRQIGVISESQSVELTEGRFSLEIPVEINRRLYDYDRLMILGPVFPHEVVGFSGGNKYLFPGVSGPQLLHFFHWLAAVITNPKIIGHRRTAVRRVIDFAAGLVELPKQCCCMVVRRGGLGGLFVGPSESAWDGASSLSRQWHITRKPKPFQTILSCAPPMYQELWVGGKCMYKLEPVLADGGELIVYAPHLAEVSATHGERIRALGYHCRDYFVKQWDRFRDEPWGILAHLTQVYGLGSFENGVERPRAQVTLATGLDEAMCRKLNLGYRDSGTIDPARFADREDEGVLLVPRAGEQLFQLEEPPAWGRPDENGTQ